MKTNIWSLSLTPKDGDIYVRAELENGELKVNGSAVEVMPLIEGLVSSLIMGAIDEEEEFAQ